MYIDTYLNASLYISVTLYLSINMYIDTCIYFYLFSPLTILGVSDGDCDSIHCPDSRPTLLKAQRVGKSHHKLLLTLKDGILHQVHRAIHHLQQ